MSKILWFSRHELTGDQLEGLKKVLKTDQVEVKMVNKSIKSAQEIKDEIKDEVLVAVVLPVWLLSELKAILPEDIIIALPKNKRIKNEATGEFEFIYDGWEVVEECKYKSKVIR